MPKPLRYILREGSQELASYENKGEALRRAAKEAAVRKSVVKVFDRDQFVKSFDGRVG